jgi:iron complex outermembrane receptor protein
MRFRFPAIPRPPLGSGLLEAHCLTPRVRASARYEVCPHLDSCAAPSRHTARPHRPLGWAVLLLLCLPIRSLAQEPDQIEVIGKREAPPYYPATSISATKTPTALREVPQSVRILSRAQLDDIGATRLDEALPHVSGIARQNSFGGLWDSFSIRGFAGDPSFGPDFFLNGFSANRGFNPPRDTANVERVEFLKGPVSALYGKGDPGGTLNIVTKPPLFERSYGYSFAAASFGSYRTTLDLTGPVSEHWAYRLNGALEDRGSFRDRVDTKRQFLAPSLLWQLSEHTHVTYTGEFLRNETPLDRGVVAVGGRLGAIPLSRNFAEPGESIRSRSEAHRLSLEHAFTERWSVRLGLSSKSTALKGFATEASLLEPANSRLLRRQRRFRDFASVDRAGQAELSAVLDTAGVQHRLLFGAEAYQFDLDQLLLRANPTDLMPFRVDVFEPAFGQPRPKPAPNTDTRERQRNQSGYLQDQIDLGSRWKALLGIRYDRYTQDLWNHRTGVRTTQRQGEWSPRLGLVFLAHETLSLYASAARSFRPNSGTDGQGQGFASEFGRSVEVGIKAELPDHRLGATLALFQIDKENVLTADPLRPTSGFSVAAGEARSRGFEVDIAGELGAGWRLSASYAYLDTEITEDSVLRKGMRLVNVPRQSGSALVVYEFAFGESSLLGFGGGMTYVGERLGSQADESFKLPSYTTAKLLAYYQPSPELRLVLDIDNLFDRDHYASSFSNVWVSPGMRRRLRLSAQGSF